MRNSAAKEYVDGVAYHWYNMLEGTYENSSLEQPGKIVGADNYVGGGIFVNQLYEELSAEGKFILASEACNGPTIRHSAVYPAPGLITGLPTG